MTIPRGKNDPRWVESDVRCFLALLGAFTCFLSVLTILYLLLVRPAPMLMTALGPAIAPLAFALVQFVRTSQN